MIFRNALIFLFVTLWVGMLFAANTVVLTPRAQDDRTSEVMDALRRLSASGGGMLKLEAGAYHFFVNSAAHRKFHVSNHDQPDDRPIFLPLEGLKNVAIVGLGKGAEFIFHGMGTALLLDHTQRIGVKNVNIRWERPYYLHATIVDFDAEGCPFVEFAKRDVLTLRNGFLTALGEDWSSRMNCGILFDGKTHEVVAGTGDIAFNGRAESIANSPRYRLELNLKKVSARAKVGDVLVLRSYYRPHPVVCLNHARDTVFKDFTFKDGFGMGILAQMSENISLLGGGTSEVVPGECASGLIDATHFSNCRGKIRIENCCFEGMMDDALNVHATSLRIEERPDANTVKCRFMHGQAIGLDLFAPGDTIRFIAAKTLENGDELKLSDVQVLNSREVLLRFAETVPERYQAKDALENASWQPSVVFRKNKAGNNRARGILLTTPGKVVVEDNVFDHVSGTVILLAGDANGWYESGACADVTIRKNRFINCLTSRYQFCDGLIAIYPIIADPAAQEKRYHRNITIEDNTFETFDVPLLFAISADTLSWKRNRVIENNKYPSWKKPKFITKFCDNLDL